MWELCRAVVIRWCTRISILARAAQARSYPVAAVLCVEFRSHRESLFVQVELVRVVSHVTTAMKGALPLRAHHRASLAEPHARLFHPNDNVALSAHSCAEDNLPPSWPPLAALYGSGVPRTKTFTMPLQTNTVNYSRDTGTDESRVDSRQGHIHYHWYKQTQAATKDASTSTQCV
jgi:hypothetical protein